MDINAAFPSDFIKASDLQGRPAIVAISHVQMERVGDDEKPCAYFQGKQKGLILNKTNAREIGNMYGPETSNWTGQQVEIYPTETDYQGKRVACVRVRRPGVNVGSPAYNGGVQHGAPVANAPQNGFGNEQPPAGPPPGEGVPNESYGLDDEIPF